MVKYRILFLLLLCSMSTWAASTPQDAAKWLEKTITPCFSRNDTTSLAARQKIERTAVTPTLKALFAKDNAETNRTHEEGKLDFDWILNAQDIPMGWKVGTPKVDGKYVAVPVETKWSDGNHTHVFLLQATGDSWLIADVRYPEMGNLLKILR